MLLRKETGNKREKEKQTNESKTSTPQLFPRHRLLMRTKEAF